MKHQKYFSNLDAIKSVWKIFIKDKNNQKIRDRIWSLCIEGQKLFVLMAIEEKKSGYSLPKTVPAYQRAVMLLEYEKQYHQAINICKEANKWGVNTDWYSKKIEKLSKLTS